MLHFCNTQHIIWGVSPHIFITHYQTPVKIGKVTVRPGDIIMGDIDGVICIPREIAYEVLLRAEGIERNEVDIFSWVRQGDTISEIIDKGGYF